MTKTIKDVAVLSGVSPSTISRVFRGSRLVNAETKRKVLEASRSCGYFPHSAARAMRGGKFQRIACVLMRYGEIGESHSNSASYLDVATDLLAQQGYSVIYEPFHLKPVSNTFIEAPRLFSELAVDGILGFDTVGVVPDYVDERIAEMHAPVVWINRTPKPGITCVNTDDVVNAKMLVKHLTDLGHRRIGYFGVNEPHYSVAERFETVVAELRSAGLETSGLALGRSDAPMLGEAQRVLDHHPAYTAVICFNFRDLYFIMCAAAGRGLVIPRDLSLCYFISPSEVRLFESGLATGIVVPESQMVQKGIELLLGAIDGKHSPGGETRVPGTLIAGFSTRAIGRES